MPFLQLDVAGPCSIAAKRRLARAFGEHYARIMQTTPTIVNVGIRELGEGGVWACTEDEPEPAAVLTCDIRRGRPADQRAELAEALIDACTKVLDLPGDRISVEFTQHPGDEMYLGRQWAAEWTPAERALDRG